jgi:hypothetical protein
MERIPTLSRALVPLLMVTAVAVGPTAAEDDVIPAPNADCTFHVELNRPARELWHRLSQNAEAVSPSATSTSRRHAANPPKGSSFVAKNFIDTEIFGKMVRDGIVWTTAASEQEFLRRVTLDLTGEIPDSATVTAFLADGSADKRDRAIDRLLASDAFVDRWTMWFGDLVENVQVATNTQEYYQGRNAYYKFIHDSIQAGKPYDKLVREAVAGSGSSFSNGETNYWVRDIQNNGPIQDTYDNLSASSGARFLALPLQCLSCHGGLGHLEQVNSGMARKTRMDFWENAAFFAQVTVANNRDMSTNAVERVVNDNTSGAYRLNTTSGNKTPRQPVNGQSIVDPAFFLTKDKPAAGEPRRTAYGRILTSNPQFARATVNYLWKELFGLGIVEPTDSFDLSRQDPAQLAAGATLQPTHPVLLTQLTNSFAAGGYDLRAVLKLMVSSNAYQLSSRYTPGVWNEAWTPYFARHYPHRLMSEAMLDAVVRATNSTLSINVTGIGAVNRAMKLPDTTEGGNFRNFLNGFGRGNRDDQRRSDDSSIVQALTLMNDRIVTDRIKGTLAGSTVARTLQATRDPGEITDALYLATLSRSPSASERNAGISYLRSGDLTRKTEDLQFALLNKLEFVFN